jgi:hypothetical protein
VLVVVCVQRTAKDRAIGSALEGLRWVVAVVVENLCVNEEACTHEVTKEERTLGLA